MGHLQDVDVFVFVQGVRRVWPKATVLGGKHLGFRIGVPGDPPEFLSGRHFTTWHAWYEAWQRAGADLRS